MEFVVMKFMVWQLEGSEGWWEGIYQVGNSYKLLELELKF